LNDRVRRVFAVDPAGDGVKGKPPTLPDFNDFAFKAAPSMPPSKAHRSPIVADALKKKGFMQVYDLTWG
jgi:hypothetical protein